jgi:murein L,D-transpeptidase YcbB/YkuD
MGVLVLACAAALGWGAQARAAPDPLQLAETVRRSVEQLRSTGRVRVAGQELRAASVLPEIYEQRGFALLWTAQPNREALLGEIAAASGDGLDPADYHFDALRELLVQSRQAPDDAGLAAAADLLLTDALARLAAHLARGKLDPLTAAPRWDLEGTVRGEPASAVLARIATGNALAVQLGELRPVQPLYGRLKSMLARYRILAGQGSWPEIGSGPVLQEGMDDPRIPLLRRRLSELGDFKGVVIDSPRFEPALGAALRSFQARRQLDPDGRFGPATRRELNRPVGEIVAQLRANLERARWLLADVRGRFVAVDPAGRQVAVLDSREPAAVFPAEFAPGVAASAPFRADLRYFVVHPDWVLPPELVRAQVAPVARRAPARVGELGLEVFRRDGTPVSPTAADWARPGDLVVRQVPGPGSFLGTLRFPAGAQSTVFIHGGPEERAALPGSVRVQDPRGLALALLGSEAGPGLDTLESALAAGVPRTINLPRPVPLLFAPWTAWVDGEGRLFLRRGFEIDDERIIAGLARGAEES